MKNDAGAMVLLTILIVSAFLLILYKLAKYFTAFGRETRRILFRMNRAADEEYGYWCRVLRCHYLCLIPFVTEHNVMKLYNHLFHRPKRIEKNGRSDGLPHLLAPSVIGACICAFCLCGTSWAWFTASSSSGTAKIESAVYSVLATATHNDSEVSAVDSPGSITKFDLTAGQTYEIKITPTGSAKTGYCKVNFEDKDYYTTQLTSGEFSFTVYASVDGYLTITPEWGTCTLANETNTIGSTLGEAPAQGVNDAAQPAVPEQDTNDAVQPAVPEQDTNDAVQPAASADAAPSDEPSATPAEAATIVDESGSAE